MMIVSLKHELEPRRWTQAEVAEHLAIVQDEEEEEEASDESSEWSYNGGVTRFTWGLNASEIHEGTIQGTIQDEDGWGRPRPKFHELLPSDNVEETNEGIAEEPSQWTTNETGEEHNNSILYANDPTFPSVTAPLVEEPHAVKYNSKGTEETGEMHTCSMVGANASTASDEATIGTRPPTRASANPPGSVALGSKTDNPDGVVQGS